MRKNTLHFYTSVTLFAVAVVGLVLIGFQQVQAALQKGAAKGETLRISEVNSCTPDTEKDDVHFTGCNSII